MPQSLLAVLLCYVFLLAILLSVLIHARVATWLKAGLIVASLGFFFMANDSLRAALGWPVRTALPEKFMLVASWVSEPEKQGDGSGSIVLWVVTLRDDRPASDPRSYRLPYDEVLHQKLTDAEMRMKQGKMQIGRRSEAPEGSVLSTASGAINARLDVELYDLPDPALPEK